VSSPVMMTPPRVDSGDARLQAAAVEQLVDAMLITNCDGTIRFANARAANLFGYSDNELLELNVVDLYYLADPGESTATLQRTWQQSEQALVSAFTGPLLLRSRTGGNIPCNARSWCFDDANVTYVAMQFHQLEGEVAAGGIAFSDANFLSNLVESFPMAVIVKEISDTFPNVMINAAYERLFNTTRSAIVGTTDYQIIPKAQADAIVEYYKGVVAGHDTQGTVIKLSTPAGELYVRSSDSIMRDADGVPQYILSVLDDCTEEVYRRREARLHRERMQNYLRVADAALMDIDADGAIVVANEKAATLFGLTKEAMTGLDYQKLPFATDARSIWVQRVASALAGEQPPNAVYSFEAAIGNRYLRWKVLPNPHRTRGTVFSVVVVGEDITEINERRLEAERANRSKSEFLANMSHELRTPLNAIIGYSEMLQEQAEDDERTEDVSDLQRIIGAGHHLLQLINEVLDLAKIESGRMTVDIEQVNLTALLEDIRGVAEGLVDANSNTFVIAGNMSVPLVSDELKLKQILLNLVSNSAKFTRSGEIRLEYDVDRTRAKFSVTDTGIGITASAQARIFEAFTQADGSTTREFGGTGLGLAICKRFCEALGGAISVDSEVGRGSTFTVVLPQTSVER
jgi:PAS domain S-box-containing protein